VFDEQNSNCVRGDFDNDTTKCPIKCKDVELNVDESEKCRDNYDTTCKIRDLNDEKFCIPYCSMLKPVFQDTRCQDSKHNICERRDAIGASFNTYHGLLESGVCQNLDHCESGILITGEDTTGTTAATGTTGTTGTTSTTSTRAKCLCTTRSGERVTCRSGETCYEDWGRPVGRHVVCNHAPESWPQKLSQDEQVAEQIYNTTVIPWITNISAPDTIKNCTLIEEKKE
jgi:hypothetical protein